MDKDSLYAAAIEGDADAISELQTYAGRVTIDDRTILHIESMDGITKRVEFILSKFATKALLAKVDSKKETALHLAAYYGHTKVVKALIYAAKYLPSFSAGQLAGTVSNPINSYKAFVRHANDSMNTALHVAVSKGNLDIAEVLVDADTSHRHTQNCNGETPIYLAAKLGYNDIVMMLCRVCKNPVLDGPQGTTALHLHASILTKVKKADKGVVGAIIDAAKRLPPSSSEDAPGSSYESFFNRCSKNDKDTALHLAVRGNHVDVVKMILEADPGYLGQNKRLYSAVDVQYLNRGVYKNKDLKTLIYMAAEQGHTYKTMVKLLCNTYEADNSLGHRGQTALHAALIMRDGGFVCSLLYDNRRLVTYSDDIGWTPLHYAAYYNFDEVLDVIVRAQQFVKYQFVSGEVVPVPLCVAAKEGHTSTVIQLMKLLPHSCAVVNYQGQNILHLAAMKSNEVMIHAILKHCPAEYIDEILNQKDVNGNTPLHVVIANGCFASELIKHPRVGYIERNNQNWTTLDMLYYQDEIVADQLQIRKALDEVRSINYYWKFWLICVTRQWDMPESVVPLSKRLAKDAEFKRVEKKLMKEELERYTRRTNTQIIVTALIATVTFTVGFTMPGGYHQSGEDDQGLVLLSRKTVFNVFMVADALALVLSISSLFLYFISSMYEDPYQVSKFNAASTGLNIVSIIAMMVTFITGTYVVLSHSPVLATTVCVISCFFFLLVILLSIKLISDRKAENRKPERHVV